MVPDLYHRRHQRQARRRLPRDPPESQGHLENAFYVPKFSLAYRLKRICSEPDTFSRRLEELRHDLMSRQYNAKIIEDAFNKVRDIPRQEALKKVVRNRTSDREPFCVTYHPALPSVAQTVRNHHRVMTSQSEVLKRCFDQPSIIAYQGGQSLLVTFL